MQCELSHQQQELVIEETYRFITLAEELFNKPFPTLPVLFDLKGRTIGMYKLWRGQKVIRYNAAIFAKYFDDNVANTVPHEVAHYIVDMHYRSFRQHALPHGKEWKSLMHEFGADASRTADYKLDDIPTRRHTRVSYSCACRQHQLGIRRHNKVMKNAASYYCRACGDILKVV
jgi:SprT protein